MKIYLIEHDKFCYDSYDGFVIVANQEDEVRSLAMERSASEGRTIWETAPIAELGIYTGPEKKPFIPLSSFNAG